MDFSEWLVQFVVLDTPAITRSASLGFEGAGLSLTDTDYRTASDGNNALDTDTGTGTTLVDATDDAVTFGGVIVITATPADATHTANFDVTFSY